MSERSKGDTSSSSVAPALSGRIVKNPLLSASVTGLTFDDFQNKPLLLPAAPPIIHTSPVVSRESTPLVTVGKSSEIDTENLSEINLNDTSVTTSSNITDTSDENSNSLLESTNQIENSILSQAASSFSQLPSVASSVFSTFSKKFNSSSGRDDFNSNPQLDIQPFTTPFVGQTPQQQILPPPTAFGNLNQQQPIAPPPRTQPQVPPVDPPTFFCPSEVPPVSSGPTCPPPASGQNTYRLSAKKKLYAQIPGLSSSQPEPPRPVSTIGFPPPIGFESLGTPVFSEQQSKEPEERKGGLFSLSNLGVPNVLQNLSGLVQSATGISQKSQEQLQQQSFGNSQIGQAPPSAFYSQTNFTATDSASSAVNFFTPSGPTLSQIPPTTTEVTGPYLASTFVNASATGSLYSGLPPKSITPESQHSFAPQQPFFQPVATSASSSRPLSEKNIFAGELPKNLTPESNHSLKAFAPEQSLPPNSNSENEPLGPILHFIEAPLTADSNLTGQPPKIGSELTSTNFQQLTQVGKNSSPLLPEFSTQTQSAEINFADLPPKSTTSVAYSAFKPFAPSQASLAQPLATGVPFGGPLPNSYTPEGSAVSHLPPQVKPPSAGPPLTSFRLQKGTRLYKSPFAPVPSEYQPQVQVPQNILPPAPSETVSFFNPQGVFPLGQEILQPTASQETTSKPAQEASISSIGNTSLLQSTVCAPAPEVVNFFDPQKLSTPTSFLISANEAAPTYALDPLPGPKEISEKFEPSISQSATNVSQVDKGPEPPKTSETLNFFNQPGVEPRSLVSDKENVASPASIKETTLEKSSVPDSIQSTGENYFSKQALQQQDTINPEPDTKLETLSFIKEQRNNILPPPPAASFGISTSSKETANFPPPPPQHSFQNQQTANPYRRGLLPQHSQLPAPTSLSSFFTPLQQNNNTFQSISSEAVAVGPPPGQEKPTSSAADILKAPDELNAKVSKLSEKIPLESTPVPSAPPSEHQQTQADPTHPEASLLTVTTPTISSALSEKSVCTSSEETKTHLLKSEAPEKPISPQPIENLSSFYKPDIISSSSNQVVASKPVKSSKIDSPTDSQETPAPEQQPLLNLFTGFFDPAATIAAPTPVVVHRPSLPDPTTFFDSFSLVPSLGVAAPPPEDPNSQRIQNFFNNPPPKELDTVGDLNYNLVGSGLSVQNLQIRSLTPASNLAEPPSSSCSEFSELNSSLSAANRQPLIQAADSTKVSPEEEAVFESTEYQDLPEEIVNELKMANSLLGTNSPTNDAYKPAVKHWFYKRKLDVKCLWTPFSYHDSALLEEAFVKGDSNLVAVEGGRFDVNISERTKTPVYWEGEPIEVKRCSWFFKASDSKYVPYEEEIAELLEEEYKKASESCEWHKKIPISAGDIVVFHGPTVIVHFQPQHQVDSWGGSTQTITRPRVVKRDLDDFNIDEGESHKVDHLLFMVHGIGSACDLKMRSVEEVVDEFRSIALQLVQSHYKNSVESGCVGRVEVLPVSWHSELHSDELGIDEKLKSITLESIPKLRNFTNDTLLDILFYTSPMFCQRIINTVTASMNSIYVKYRQRNPAFQGGVSLAGHSLGSLIMFDLLCHQSPHKESEDKNMENPDEMTTGVPVDSNQLNEEASTNITYKMGQAGTGQPFISYPQLLFQPKKFFALGSPIGMFVTIRGIDKLGLDFHLPTCPGFYNIFHPYDPVAYRLEALVNPDMTGIQPVLIPHHKGRKRMHLELKETMSRVGADLKQRFFETFKTTLDSVNFLTPKLKNDPKELEKEVDKLLELQATQEQQTQQGAGVASTSRSRANSNSTNQSDTDVIEIDFPVGKLNESKRVDYVLQEAPLEFFNEYLFALSSHVCYWESEDTILFVMKQIYSGIGFSPDSQVPQQTLTIERPSSCGSTTQLSPTS